MNPDFAQSLWATFASGLLLLVVLFGPLAIIERRDLRAWWVQFRKDMR